MRCANIIRTPYLVGWISTDHLDETFIISSAHVLVLMTSSISPKIHRILWTETGCIKQTNGPLAPRFCYWSKIGLSNLLTTMKEHCKMYSRSLICYTTSSITFTSFLIKWPFSKISNGLKCAIVNLSALVPQTGTQGSSYYARGRCSMVALGRTSVCPGIIVWHSGRVNKASQYDVTPRWLFTLTAIPWPMMATMYFAINI